MVLSTILAYPTHAVGRGQVFVSQTSGLKLMKARACKRALNAICEEARERHYWGIQTGPFAALEATFVLKIF